MSKLFYKQKTLIGLDISQTGIKVMAIDPKRWLVLGYGSLDLDPAKVQGSFDNPEDTYLSESIASLLNNNIVGSIGSDHVVVGLPTGKTFSRTFTLPASEEKKY
jgi:type IV pilus assembly protein PilM